jgi:hypothetical protein
MKGDLQSEREHSLALQIARRYSEGRRLVDRMVIRR